MEFRQLHYVVQIAIEKNFSRAAEKLHIAQPSLSQQLSKLEKELGLLLFSRNTNSVELTHAGTVFVEKARDILDRSAQLKKEMEDISQLRKGKVIVGSLPITGSHLLPLVLPVFQRNFPEIEVVLIEDTSSHLEELTIGGQTDLSLLCLPVQEQLLSYEVLVEEAIHLAVPPHHPLTQLSSKTISLSDLSKEPFIVLKKGQGFRQIVFDLCAQAGFEPKIVFESSNIETVQSLVAAGMGIALVPYMVSRTQGSPHAPAYLTLNNKPTRTLVIASRKGRYLSKAAEAFMMTTCETIRNTP